MEALRGSFLTESNSPASGVPVYVATNLPESMVTRRTPTRAEVNDVMNTLRDGAKGLVLAAETAIGSCPVEVTRMTGSLMREYEASIE
ncbi:MAG: pyruvate kinase [Thermoplasmata archaeon]